jgi:hypothetical protein
MTVRRVSLIGIVFDDPDGTDPSGLGWLVPLRRGDGSWCVITEDGVVEHGSASEVREFVADWVNDLFVENTPATASELVTFESHEELARLFEELGRP